MTDLSFLKAPSPSLLALTFLVLLTSQSCPSAEASNILFFIGFGGPSHRLAMTPLADALVKNNHSVTFLVQEKPKEDDKRFSFFIPKKLATFFENMRSDINFYDMRASGGITFSSVFIQWFGVTVCNELYTDPDFLEFVSSHKFDLVIMDGLFNECGYAIAHTNKAKTIIFSISTVLPWVIDSLGVPDETSSIPDPMLPYPKDRTFLQRTLSAVAPVFWKIFRKFYYLPKLTNVVKAGLGDDQFPDFAELERNTSLVLVNTHVTQEYPRSLPPNIVPVGGISWVEKRKPLPERITNFINEGKEGFIYVSFGSFIDFLTFPKHVQQTFLNALLKFPNIQLIWKLNETPKDLPKNILVEKWLPQQDLLRHPKIRAFITHSGIGGVNEAIYSSVPLICFPLFTEQDYNAELVSKKGFGLKMEIINLDQRAMESAIQEMLTNDSYKENMKKTTKLFLDRPMKPLETALWHTEYVLRNEDLGFLRPDNINQSWWVKRQLDVWLFLTTIVIFINLLGVSIMYKVFRYCCKRKRSTTATMKKEKKM